MLISIFGLSPIPVGTSASIGVYALLEILAFFRHFLGLAFFFLPGGSLLPSLNLRLIDRPECFAHRGIVCPAHVSLEIR
jgi:hypothetical protein